MRIQDLVISAGFIATCSNSPPGANSRTTRRRSPCAANCRTNHPAKPRRISSRLIRIPVSGEDLDTMFQEALTANAERSPAALSTYALR